jgi:hypothetical protein
VRQLAHAVEVDEMARSRQPKGHHGRQALAARDQARVFVRQITQKARRLREGGGSVEREGCGLQRRSPGAQKADGLQPLLIDGPCQTIAPKSERIAHTMSRSDNLRQKCVNFDVSFLAQSG